MIRIASIGECMIELRHRNATVLDLAFGGDTLNTAVYLARLTRGRDVQVDYVTALGDDAYSEAMVEAWRSESLGTGLVARLKAYEAMGYDEYSFWIDTGMSFARKKASLERFIADVMPAFGE